MVKGWTDPDFSREVTVTVDKVTATFTVEIIAAHERSYRDSVRGEVTDAYPSLRVTTYRTYDDSAEVIIRKRGYRVDEAYSAGVAGYPDGWQSGTAYGRGFRNDNDVMVEYQTATRKQLQALATAARDAFIAEQPGWERRSLLRLINDKVRRELSEISDLHRRIAQHEARLAELRAEESKLA